MVRRYQHLLIPIAIVVFIAVVYANDLHGPFIYDDYNSVLQNDHIESIFPLSRSMTAPDRNILVGRPIVCLSMAINYAVGGRDPFTYHLFNISTHIACALLLYGIVRRTVLLPHWQGRFENDAPGFAGAVAMIWSLHPLQTEAVDYISQRTETMESMFLLLTIYSVLRAATSERAAMWRISAVAACGLGMGCKEQMIVAPLLVMLYDSIFLPPARSRGTQRALYAGLIATWMIVPLELWGADMDSKSGYGLKYLTRLDYLQTQAGVIVHYLRLSIWPTGLTIDYTDWPIATHLSGAILPGLLVVALLAASVLGCIRQTWWGFLGAWFFLILGPTSSVLPNFTEVVAERRMYMPLVSVVIIILAGLWSGLKKRWPVMLIAAILAVLTILRNHDYRGNISIWSDAAQKRPASWLAHYSLALAYGEKSQWDQAWEQNEIAIRLMPAAVRPAELREKLLPHITRPDTRSAPADH
jgi:hypothetical protein